MQSTLRRGRAGVKLGWWRARGGSRRGLAKGTLRAVGEPGNVATESSPDGLLGVINPPHNLVSFFFANIKKPLASIMIRRRLLLFYADLLDHSFHRF